MKIMMSSLAFVLAFSGLANHSVSASCIKATDKVAVYGLNEGEEPDKEDIEKLKKKTMKKAWNAYVETLPANYMKAYMSQKAEILKELNFYIPDQNQKFEYTYEEYETAIVGTNCITVNFERLKASLKVQPEAPTIKSGKGSKFVTLFIAREAAKEETFDANRNSSSSAEAGGKKSSLAKEKLQASGGTAISITKQKASVSTTRSSSSRGNTLRKSDRTKYRIISSKAADGAMSQSLTDAGYEAALYKMVGAFCKGVSYKELQETYRTEEELDGDQLTSAMLAAIKCKMKFFALGTMTADVVRDDVQTGLKMVTVRVQGEIYNLKDFPPSRVAVIPPQQYPGLGSNQNEARTNALIDAGKEAGLLITKTLQNKQIQ